MSVFYSAAAALTEPNLENALEQTLRVVAEDLRLDAAWVWLLDENRNSFYLAASYDLPPYLREPLHMTGEPCWCMQAFYDGEFVSRNVDIITCSRLQEGLNEAGPGATRGLRSHASIALRFGDHALGLLNAARAEQPAISPAELETLATIGAQVGVAVERARLAERAAAAARVEERASLARELHDTILQDLTAISLHLEGAARKTKTDPAKANERIATAIGLTRTALDDLRRSVDGLRNDPLNGEPLVSALSRLTRRMTSETGIQIALHLDNPVLPLLPQTEFAAFRIVSEALTNVQRHAAARRVDIGLHVRDAELVLRVRDDGQGFEPATSGGGFGIVGMRERAEALGGRVQVDSTRDAGTTITAVLPLSVA
jgi:two-component system NarL family sensor kinase